jgi:iron complex transport system substrate-binding protein
MNWLRVVSSAVVIAVLAACGAPAASTSTTIETGSPLATTPAVENGAAASLATTPAADAYPRTVTDTGGRALTFNQRPERVVLATYRNILDELLLLDVTPLAYAAWLEEQLPVWTRQTLDQRGITLTNLNGQAYPAEINFEQLAALQPDLIIIPASEGDAETIENFALFEQIAPVFVVSWDSIDADRLRLFAEIFAVESKVAEIEARDAELFASVTPPPADQELVVGFGYGCAGPIASAVYNPGPDTSMHVLERAGFTIKDFGRPAGEDYFDVAEENFALLDADMLWNVSPYPGSDGEAVPCDARAFESSNIFQNLPVFKEGRYRSLNVDQSQAILQWTPLATPFLAETLNELVASYEFETN